MFRLAAYPFIVIGLLLVLSPVANADVSPYCPATNSRPIFSYTEASAGGPSRWYELCPSWSTCRRTIANNQQSPIYFNRTQDYTFVYTPLVINYRSDATCNVTNTGRLTTVDFAPGSYSNVSGSFLPGVYELRTIRLHFPSEHLIEPISLRSEVQFVHVNPLNASETVILSVLLTADMEDDDSVQYTFLDDLENKVLGIASGNTTTFQLDLTKAFAFNTSTFYSYKGSLTLPPCTENVRWIVFDQVQRTNLPQIRRFLSIFQGSNARPAQQSRIPVTRYAYSAGEPPKYWVVETMAEAGAIIVLVLICVGTAIAIACICWRKKRARKQLREDLRRAEQETEMAEEEAEEVEEEI